MPLGVSVDSDRGVVAGAGFEPYVHVAPAPVAATPMRPHSMCRWLRR